MNRAYYSAVIPEPVLVLGLPLLPLSLGHLILLNRMESAFVIGGQPTFQDLAVSVAICAQRYEDALASLSDPDLPTFMHRWHEKLVGNDRWSVRLGLRPARTIDFEKECSAFIDYLKLNQSGPPVAKDPRAWKPLTFPEEQLVKVRLMRDLHLTETEALNRSWLLCLWDYDVLSVIDGHCDIVDDEMRSAIHEAQDVARALHERFAERRQNGVRS